MNYYKKVFGFCLLLSVCLWACTNVQDEKKYQDALSQNIDMMKSMEREKQNDEIEREKNDECFKKQGEVRNWLEGTWEYSGEVSCRLAITYNEAILYTSSGISDKGFIKDIDINEGRMSFGEYSYVEFDYSTRSLYYSQKDNKLFRKISDEPLLCYRNMGGNSASNNSSSNDSRLMSKFNRLNEEGRKLVDEIGQYYRSGQAGPWVITDVYRLKQIAEEKIDLARQMGDRDLEALCRQQKAQTLTALRQMGF